jgi:arginyl-tRNA synthetase
MNVVNLVERKIYGLMANLPWKISVNDLSKVEVVVNIDKEGFGDLSCNAALIVAKIIGKSPRDCAQELKKAIEACEELALIIAEVTIAGPGFVNMTLKPSAWATRLALLYNDQARALILDAQEKHQRILIEFVSANPTGPLHLGHGRGGIIGDVLARVMSFLGHTVEREFYINDAGNQIKRLGASFKARCLQQLGQQVAVPEDGYQGDYLMVLAERCIAEQGANIVPSDDQFFIDYARTHLLGEIKKTLTSYGVSFDTWFSEKTLHDDGSVEQALDLLKQKQLLYEQDGAWWFCSKQFGDEKDRVVKKQDGELTYIAADIAYHKDKFDRGYDKIIDILGQDHHGYVMRLKATMQALGYDAGKLGVILYQLVSIKMGDQAVKMSKRAGTFTELREIIDEVGVDVARFFYLNRKADSHLEFDLATALKETDENPVYYLQYAYVRTGSLLSKAHQDQALAPFVDQLMSGNADTVWGKTLERLLVDHMSTDEVMLIKKIDGLYDMLRLIAARYQTHLLASYVCELAGIFHSYYTRNKIIDPENIDLSRMRLTLVLMVRRTLQLCCELLGITCPDKM